MAYSLNAVEREPVPIRVLNLNASEASFKPKQRSYIKMKLEKIIFLLFFFRGDFGRGDFILEPIKGTGSMQNGLTVSLKHILIY